MTTVYDVNANALIEKASEEFKNMVKSPSWAIYVKTGAGKERPPVNKEWYYKRLASVLRKIYLFGPIGTNRLRIKYSNRKNMGNAGERVYKGSGKIIRTCLQELEKLHNIFSEFGRKRGTGVLSEDTANLTDLIRVFEAIEPRTETLRMSLHAISDQKDEMEQLNKILIALRTQARNIKIYLYNRRRLLER